MKKIHVLLLGAATLLAACSPSGNKAPDVPLETLQEEFQNPPKEARARVWWHWMGNDVTESGIRADFDWFKKIGVVGFHQFNLGGSQGEVVYQSQAWKDRMYFAARLADSLGLEMGIPSSPGFSATAGPWVKPEDGMKKLVWRTVEVDGGKVDITLPPSFKTIGAFQNGTAAGRSFDETVPETGAEVAVVAVKVPENQASSRDAKVTASGGDFSLEILTDNDIRDGGLLPPGKDGYAWIQYEFPEEVTVRSLSIVGAHGGGGFPGMRPAPASETLEVSADGKDWTYVCDVRGGSMAQATQSVPPTKGRFFRLKVNNPAPAPAMGGGLFGGNASDFAGLSGMGGNGIRRNPGTQISEFVLYPYTRVNRAEDKAGFSAAANLMASPTPASDEAFPSTDDVIDITDKVDADGHLVWDAPEGHWRVYRFAWSLTGEVNHPAPENGEGLEVDKLSREAYSRYIHNYLDMYKDATKGYLGAKGIQYLLCDSYEAENENWTPSMFDEFQALRGYSLRSWLPALAGEVIGSPEETDRFLHDWRQTIGDLTARSYSDLTDIIKKDYGMAGGYYESHEGGRAYVVDGMDVKKTASVPMGAMWVESPWLPKGPDGKVNRTNQEADLRESSSVAHIYGQNYVAAESMTTWGNQLQYQYVPSNLKETADQELANGVNRFYIHLSAHQPRETVPGIGMGGIIGQWFNRHETWAPLAGAWIDYISRSSYLLSSGRNVADILYYYGEDANITSLFSRGSGIPEGWQWDYCNPTALMEEMQAGKDGLIYARKGGAYRLLWMDRNIEYMSVPVLRKIAALVKDGVQLAGAKPLHPASLSDDPAEFEFLVKEIWGSGRANVHETDKIAEALQQAGISQDVTIPAGYRYLHRDCGKTQIYWINKPSAEKADVTLSFRVSGLRPSLWHPESGVMEDVSYKVNGDRTDVELHLMPNDAVFVVFSGKAEASETVAPKTRKEILTVTGPWEVSFEQGRGAPEKAVFDHLQSWTESEDFGIRYFSGVATYKNTFNAPESDAALALDLGAVGDLAEVIVNGVSCGTVWKEPWQVCVTDAVKPGENTLEIRVANRWINRLVGDNQPDAPERICLTPGVQDIYPADYPIYPSGLFGPVRLIEIR